MVPVSRFSQRVFCHLNKDRVGCINKTEPALLSCTHSDVLCRGLIWGRARFSSRARRRLKRSCRSRSFLLCLRLLAFFLIQHSWWKILSTSWKRRQRWGRTFWLVRRRRVCCQSAGSHCLCAIREGAKPVQTAAKGLSPLAFWCEWHNSVVMSWH